MSWHRILFVFTTAVLLIGAIVLISQPSRAAGPWYVQPDGNDGNDCMSPASPCATIQAAIDKASPGDTIYAAVGVYTGVDEIVVEIEKEDLFISGGWDISFSTQEGYSIINGEYDRRGIDADADVTVEKFAVQDCTSGIGNSNNGNFVLTNSIVSDNLFGGISNSGTMTLNNVSVVKNSGPGVVNMGSTMILNNSNVSHNRAGNGGGIFNSDILILNNSTVSNNVANGVGGGVFNDLYYSGDVGQVFINNSTITGNSADQGGGIFNDGTNVTIQNSILAGNIGDISPDCHGSIDSQGFNLLGDDSDCTFNSSSGDIIGEDPLLGQLISIPGYHHLFSESPAIDAGNPAGCEDQLGNPLDTDQRGAARVGRCDIGSYEYTLPGNAAKVIVQDGSPQRAAPMVAFDIPLQAVVMDDIGSPVENISVTFSTPISGASGTFYDSGDHTITDVTNQSGLSSAGTLVANDISGAFSVTAAADGVLSPTIFDMTNIVWYVTTDGNDVNSCQAPADPCASVSGVFQKSDFVVGDAILVGEGTYTGSGYEVLLLDKSTHLIGGWNAAFTEKNGKTILDGKGSRRGINVVANGPVIVDNFVVQNGFSDERGGGISSFTYLTLNNTTITNNSSTYYGGGIYQSFSGKLILNNCIVKNNHGHEGGGAASESTIIINNSTIRDNDAFRGGGIYSRGIVHINNTTISNNVAISGGGIATDSIENMTINNSTIYSNTVLGISISQSEGSTIRNSILYGNMGEQGLLDCEGTIQSGGYNLIGAPGTCQYSLTTTDLIGVDPRVYPYLTGSPGYHPLLPSSPAIDGGNPSGCVDHQGDLLLTDQRGTMRPLDGDDDGNPICDIGAYEFDPDNPTGEIFLTSLPKNYCPDFFDDFSDPASGWFVGDDGYHLVDYFNQEYRVLTKQSEYIYLFRAPTCAQENYVVEADLRWNGDDYGYGYGLLFGLNGDYSQYYYFEVLAMNNAYRLFRRDSSGFSQLRGLTYSPVIHTGTGVNHLKVTRDGDQIILNVNGTNLGTWTDGVITGLTYTGIATNPYLDKPVSDLRVDNFSADYFSGGVTSLVQTNNAVPVWLEKVHFREKAVDLEK